MLQLNWTGLSDGSLRVEQTTTTTSYVFQSFVQEFCPSNPSLKASLSFERDCQHRQTGNSRNWLPCRSMNIYTARYGIKQGHCLQDVAIENKKWFRQSSDTLLPKFLKWFNTKNMEHLYNIFWRSNFDIHWATNSIILCEICFTFFIGTHWMVIVL